MTEYKHKIGFYIKRLVEVKGFSEEEICQRARLTPRRFKMLRMLGAIPTKIEFRRSPMMMRQVAERDHKEVVSIYKEAPATAADHDVEEKGRIDRETAKVKDRITPRMHEVLHLLRETHTEETGAIELWRADATIATRMSKKDLVLRDERDIDGRIRRFYTLTQLGAAVLRSLGRPG